MSDTEEIGKAIERLSNGSEIQELAILQLKAILRSMGGEFERRYKLQAEYYQFEISQVKRQLDNLKKEIEEHGLRIDFPELKGWKLIKRMFLRDK